MIIKKIILDNIRSYKHEEINFPQGSLLLSGDIGSGKTSVLLGIEFALFGLQPGQRGASLLRNGKIEGGVKIIFEIDGEEIIVERTLKRGKTVSQDYCAITKEGEKKEISVTELKDRVLQALSYPKEFAKKQNILYKFTVYTPQEEMKQIILEDPETRINTLRHVFGIDKYKKVLENTSVLTLKLREEKRVKEGLIEYLEQNKTNLVSKEEELEAKRYNLTSVEKELFLKTEERKKIQEEKEEIAKKIDEKNRLNQEIDKTTIMIVNKKESVSNNEKLKEKIKEQIEELSFLKFNEEEIIEFEQQILFRKKEKEELNNENLRITSQISSLNLKNSEEEHIKQKLRELELCPTCLQNVDPVHKSNVINKIDGNLSENTRKIEELTLEKEKVLRTFAEVNDFISSKEKQLQELKILKIKLQEINEKKQRLDEINNSNDFLKKDMEILNQHVEGLNKSVFDLNKFDNLFLEKQKELEEALKQERMAEIKLAELRQEIEVFSRQI